MAAKKSAAKTARDAAESALRKVWGARFAARLHDAVIAFHALAPAKFRNMRTMDRIGNDPVVLQLLANAAQVLCDLDYFKGVVVGKLGVSVVHLMQMDAYWDIKHKDHQAISAVVECYFAAGGQNPLRPKPTKKAARRK